MSNELPQQDPSGAYGRKVRAKRRVGNKQCACGENRPQALIPGSNPTICAACDRKRKGKTTMDKHHPAGRANSPMTVPIPVNDHRACLSVAQADWPSQTLENPDRCPLLAAAAGVRGCIDTIIYLVKNGLLWIANMLEKLSAFLRTKLGPKWWINTELQQFAPKG